MKPKPKPVVHHKKPLVHKKVKVVQHPATKLKVHVVAHKVNQKAVTASPASARSIPKPIWLIWPWKTST